MFDKKTAKVVDPVCGMTINPGSAAGSLDHGGTTYYFCSKHCLASFQADPAKYATSGS
jgi:Cu+-exporting ATPase